MVDGRTEASVGMAAEQSAVAWSAVIAGGMAAAALTLVLVAFGAGMGFSSISPWPSSGVSAGTFKIAAGIYLLVVAMLSSTIGGYIAGRLRTKWTGLHSEEVLFRDTAHGFLAWATATVVGAAALASAATFIAGGATAGAAQGASQGAAQAAAGPNAYFVDLLLRPQPGAAAPTSAQSGDAAATRAEVLRILGRGLREGGEIPANDRSYLAQMVAAHTSLPQQEAEKRVSDVTNQARAAADEARSAAAKLSLWLTAAMLVGAFSAALAAIEGGQLRDGTWRGVIGAGRYHSTTGR
jgi:hypothetical protein